jgi:hypothetical protein
MGEKMEIKLSYNDISKKHILGIRQCSFCKNNLIACRILMLPASICIGLAGTAALMADVGAGYANLQAEVAE